jgi:hypothetical protein
MCTLCADCVSKCYCPRCPFQIIKPESCLVCGIKGECTSDCIVQEHFLGKVFCQVCVTNKHNITFNKYTPKMHCIEHETLHKMLQKGVTCLGCLENQPNQMAHMDCGGCMEM